MKSRSELKMTSLRLLLILLFISTPSFYLWAKGPTPTLVYLKPDRTFKVFEPLGSGGTSLVYTIQEKTREGGNSDSPQKTYAAKIVTQELSPKKEREIQRSYEIARSLGQSHPDLFLKVNGIKKVRIGMSDGTDIQRMVGITELIDFILPTAVYGTGYNFGSSNRFYELSSFLELATKYFRNGNRQLAVMAEKGVVHGDMKLRNNFYRAYTMGSDNQLQRIDQKKLLNLPKVVYDELILSDPDSYTYVNNRVTTFSVTTSAPEVLLDTPTTSTTDYYSFATSLYMLFTHESPKLNTLSMIVSKEHKDRVKLKGWKVPIHELTLSLAMAKLNEEFTKIKKNILLFKSEFGDELVKEYFAFLDFLEVYIENGLKFDHEEREIGLLENTSGIDKPLQQAFLAASEKTAKLPKSTLRVNPKFVFSHQSNDCFKALEDRSSQLRDTSNH